MNRTDVKLFRSFIDIIENGSRADWLFFGELLLFCYRNPAEAFKQVKHLKTIIDSELDSFLDNDIEEFIDRLYTRDVLGDKYVEGADYRQKISILQEHFINLIKG